MLHLIYFLLFDKVGLICNCLESQLYWHIRVY